MQRVLIIGAGGHAQVVADILLRSREAGESVTPVGYLDDDPALHGHLLLGIPVLGATSLRTSVAHDALILAIGNNNIRSRLFQQLVSGGERFAIARHPSSIVAPDVQLQPGTVIAARAVVNPSSHIGANVILNTGCTVDHHNRIADHAHIAPGVHLGGDVQVGEGTLIGIGATVMPQRQIGAWSTIGAGSLVHGPVADHTLVVGVPARVIKHVRKK